MGYTIDTIQLMFAVLLTTITGSIFAVIWYLIGNLLEKAGFLNIVYHFLKVVAVFYFIPVAFIFMMYINGTQDVWMGKLFVATPLLVLISRIFCTLWLFGVVVFLVRYIYRSIRLSIVRRRAFPCKAYIQQYYEEICEELHISPNKVTVAYSYHMSAPCICGVFKPKILLPVEEYGKRELRVIFLHELAHYRQKDVLFKQITCIAVILHFFNPIIRIFQYKVDEWGEYSIDYDVCNRLGDFKGYVETIFYLATGTDLMENVPTQLAERDSSLLKRTIRMKKNLNRKKCSRTVAALIVFGMLVISTGAVYAATIGTAEAYVAAFDETDVEVVQSVQVDSGDEEEELVEFIDTQSDEEFTVVVEDENSFINARSTGGGFEWTVGSKVIRQSSAFKGTSGNYITVVAELDPTNLKAYVGIIEPDGTKRCVYGSGSINSTFSLDQTGSYRVYVRNANSKSIDVTGVYFSKY